MPVPLRDAQRPAPQPAHAADQELVELLDLRHVHPREQILLERIHVMVAGARTRSPRGVKSVRIARPWVGSGRRWISFARSSCASTSFIDCGVISARRASCALERPGRERITESAVYCETVSPCGSTSSAMRRRRTLVEPADHIAQARLHPARLRDGVT